MGRKCILDIKTAVQNDFKQDSIDICSLKQHGYAYIELRETDMNNSYTIELVNSIKSVLDVSESKVRYRKDIGYRIIQLSNISLQGLPRFLEKLQNLDGSFWDRVKQVTAGSLDIMHLSKAHNLSLKHAFPGGKICAKPREIKHGIFHTDSDCKMVTANYTNYYDTDYNFVFKQNGSDSTVAVHACDGFYKAECPSGKYMELSERYFNISAEKVLLHHPSGKTFKFFEYLPTSYGATICSPSTSTQQWQAVADEVEKWIALVALTLSIIAYVVVIFHSCFIKEERNIPTINTACLCLALLASDIVYLAQTGTPGSSQRCKAAAILRHYFDLVCHTWNGIITYDICSVLLKPMQYRDVNIRRRVSIYVILASILPMLVTLACIVVDVIVPGAIQYGQNDTCTIDNTTAKIVAYLAPSMVIDLGAIAVLAFTLCTLHQTQSQRESSGESFNYIWIAFKVACMLGLTEIVMVIQIPNPTNDHQMLVNTVATLLYVFLRCSRGVFIMVFILMYKSNRDSIRTFLNRWCCMEVSNTDSVRSLARSKTSATTVD